MKRIKRSPIWKIDRDQFIKIVKESDTMGSILKHFGLNDKGGNYKTVHRRCEEEGIDISHIKRGKGSNLGRKFQREKIPLEEILCENSDFSRYHLKNRLLDENILENVCEICGQEPFWNGKVLVLHLDHINGVSNDHRLENLRIICPHCHSQTNTFAGRNKNNEG